MVIFTVTNLDDSGDGSLRQAIEIANEQEGRDIIEFDESLKGETITLTSGELKVTDDLTIAGLGADQLTVSGSGNSRVFNIDDETDELTGVSITGLKITGGFSDGDAGGIKSNENLTVANSIIAGNSAEQEGGGIRNFGELTVVNSTISGNTTNSQGGGIDYQIGAETTIIDSTISDNTAGGNGGGIDVGSSEIVRIINSTISNNTANGVAGGIVGTPNMTNSTVSDNTAGGSGGGIFTDGNATVTNSTISGNISNDSGGGIFSDGGLVTVDNSTITGNTANNNGGGILNDGDTIATDSIISLNIADFDRDGIGDGGGVFNSAAATFTNNNTLIFGNIPNDVFTEGISMMDGVAFTDMTALA